MAKIRDTDLLVVNRAGVDYKSPKSELGIPTKVTQLENDADFITVDEVPEVDLDGYATEEWVENKNYITLEDVPEPDLEGVLIFKGNVENEAALPDDAAQGDMYYNEEDQHLYAKGETEWHKLDTIDDIDLSEYARLDGADFTGAVSVPELTVGPDSDGKNIIHLDTNELEAKEGEVFSDWTGALTPEENIWLSVTYGDGKFVAVANSGTNRVMHSDDAITWTSASATEAAGWNSVTYGDGKFVAVAYNGTNRVMYSDDGITWSNLGVTGPITGEWRSVTYADGKFVAVAYNGTNRVIYSDDGITWSNTGVTGVEFVRWESVTYGDGKFVAISFSGTNRVMYSADGITWTSASATEANRWYSVTYGNGKFVAVSEDGYNRVMYSADGITWSNAGITGVPTESHRWSEVTYGDGKFVAVSNSGSTRVMHSPDGITWTVASATEANNWNSVTYGDNKFVSVASSGTNRAMYATFDGGSGGGFTGKGLYFNGARLLTEDNLEDGDDVDLTPYAKLDDDEQSITAKEFIGDGSKLTNLPIPNLEGSYVGGPYETSPTAPAIMNEHGETLPREEQVEANYWNPSQAGIWVGTKLASDAGWNWNSSDGQPNIVDDKPTVIYINGIPFDVDVNSQFWGQTYDQDRHYIPFPLSGDDLLTDLQALVDQEVIVSWYPGEAGVLDGYATEAWVDNQEYAKCDGSRPFTGMIHTSSEGIQFESAGFESKLWLDAYSALGLCTEIVFGDYDGGAYGKVETEDLIGQRLILKEKDSTSTRTVHQVMRNGVERYSVNAAGTVTATEFIGDGSKLTNLPGGGGGGGTVADLPVLPS